MISVYSNDLKIAKKVEKFFDKNSLEKKKVRPLQPLKNFLRVDYDNPLYKKEADISNPNFTPSRKKIFENNIIVFDGINDYLTSVNTLTTKQDRNPNSGLVAYNKGAMGKSPYRNLTPRECFMLMGFSENDFQSLLDNDFVAKKGQDYFSREKLVKMAGNSIVVNVLEEIMKQIVNINDKILIQVPVNSLETLEKPIGLRLQPVLTVEE